MDTIDGQPIDVDLRRQRITIDESRAQARLQQIPGLADVRPASSRPAGRSAHARPEASPAS